METIIILASVLIVFSIGYGFGKTKIDDDFNLNSFEWERANNAERERANKAESKMYELKRQLELERRKYYNIQSYEKRFCCSCYDCGIQAKFYGKNSKEQEIADLLKQFTLTTKDLAKKLDIDIKKLKTN